MSLPRINVTGTKDQFIITIDNWPSALALVEQEEEKKEELVLPLELDPIPNRARIKYGTPCRSIRSPLHWEITRNVLACGLHTGQNIPATPNAVELFDSFGALPKDSCKACAREFCRIWKTASKKQDSKE